MPAGRGVPVEPIEFKNPIQATVTNWSFYGVKHYVLRNIKDFYNFMSVALNDGITNIQIDIVSDKEKEEYYDSLSEEEYNQKLSHTEPRKVEGVLNEILQ